MNYDIKDQLHDHTCEGKNASYNFKAMQFYFSNERFHFLATYKQLAKKQIINLKIADNPHNA